MLHVSGTYKFKISPKFLIFSIQNNEVTHWLDLSQLYGSSPAMARDLREFRGGRLRVGSGPDGQMLPNNPAETACTGTCFKVPTHTHVLLTANCMDIFYVAFIFSSLDCQSIKNIYLKGQGH